MGERVDVGLGGRREGRAGGGGGVSVEEGWEGVGGGKPFRAGVQWSKDKGEGQLIE